VRRPRGRPQPVRRRSRARGRRGRGLSTAGLLVLAALVASCTIGEGAGTSDEAPAASDEDAEATEAEPDPTAVPDDVDDLDAAYVQAVVDELLPLIREADLAAARAAPLDTLPSEVVATYRAVFSPAVAAMWIPTQEQFLGDEDDAAIYEQVIREQGEPRWDVSAPWAPSHECLGFHYTFDVEAGGLRNPGEVAALVPLDDERDPDDRNPTPWVIGLHGDPNHDPSYLEEPTEQDGAEEDERFSERVFTVCSATAEANAEAADEDAALAER
jgi:hypothetical protein